MRKLLASIAVLCLAGWNFTAFAASVGGGGGGFGGGGHAGGGFGGHSSGEHGDGPAGGAGSYHGPQIMTSGTGRIDGKDAQLFTVALHRKLGPTDIKKLKDAGWSGQSYGPPTYYCHGSPLRCIRFVQDGQDSQDD